MVSQITQILHLSEEEIRDHSKLLVNAFDDQHRIWFWNKQCEKYFGIAEEDALGQILEDMLPNIRTNPKLDYMNRALSGECIYDADGRFQNNDLSYTQLVLPLKNKKGAIIGIVNIVRPSSDSTPRARETKTQYLLSEVS
jgi:PAS domain S-box-containing protein